MNEQVSEKFTEELQVATDTIITTTSPIVQTLKSFVTVENGIRAAVTILIVVLLGFLFHFIRKGSKNIITKKYNNHIAMLVDRFLKYLFYALSTMYILGACGIKMTTIWGAAGVAGIAIGFAAQTSVSNVISGIFVLAEKSMKVGDLITIGDITGIIDAIDLLSIKIHTPDNQFIRIPNSTVMSANLKNTTYYDKRRFTLPISISYDTDMEAALEALKKAPALCPHALQEPAPLVWYDAFGESGINMTLAIWCEKSDFLTLKNEAFCAAKKVFDEAGIEIPYNKLDVNILKMQQQPTA